MDLTLPKSMINNTSKDKVEYKSPRPYVDDYGIYEPTNPFTDFGFGSNYKMVMSKEIFVEAYNKWIKEDK